ncbi:MAG: Fe-S oxidoreductase [Deltaproteobacteria bacterium]|nr:Fe-S oxidoreductase [Deltaproteobacteria bacterium]
MNKILLVEPNFPIPDKSRNHSNFLPIGLLKIAAYHRSLGDDVELHRGNYIANHHPDEIKITSLFTYWSKQVWESVQYYRELYPSARIEIGGIYASLMPQHAKASGSDAVVVGLYKEGIAEDFEPAYDLVNVDYQIVHASRGCFRKCDFCGTWKIEPDVTYKKNIKHEIRKKKVILYDNNLIANPHIKDILSEIAEFKFPDQGRVYCESQSGLDGRILIADPEIASFLKKARFLHPRIAWDGPYKLWPIVKEQIQVLREAGFPTDDIFVFMLFNHTISYSEMRAKLDACRRWKVRVIDCRFRPLDSTSDNYKPRVKRQDESEYYIHKSWTDKQVRAFRRAVRRQNIALILELPDGRYIEGVEKQYMPT